jgi:putative redox protein
MVPLTITYRGSLRCEATHGPSGTTLLTDAPVDNHGRGESFSPTDLIATGLATCICTTMAIVAKREGIRLEEGGLRVEKHMTTAPPRRIARLVVAVAMPGGLSAEQRAKLERAAHTCPVSLSLHPDVAQDISFSYPD